MHRTILTLVLSTTLAGATAAAAQPAACGPGAYRSPGGDVVALTVADSGFNYVFRDGRMGNTAHPASRVRCLDGAAAEVRPGDAGTERWERVPLRMTRTRFTSGGTTLAGVLIEPVDAGAARPLVVTIHGSASDEEWVGGRIHWPFTLAGQGLAVFTFDKRGTGESEGTFTMDFRRLADDVVAASAEARRLAGSRVSRFGLYGMSQGGWIAPMAAAAAGADFIVVGFGPAYSPLEEDAEEVLDDLRAKGHAGEVIERARAVAAATAGVVRAGFASGYEELARVKAAYGAEPWFADIEGEYSGWVLRTPEAQLRAEGPGRYHSLGIPWSHDAMAVLRTVDVPQLWIVPGKDAVMPSALTLQRLTVLQREGKPIQVAVFPDADHQMLAFTPQPDGSRRYTRGTEGVYRLLRDWIAGCAAGAYGNATFTPPLPPSPASCGATNHP